MKQTIYGVVGYKGKLGSLLVRRPNFVPITCDITNIDSVKNSENSLQDVDVLVNCAAISSVDDCEAYPLHAHLMNIIGANNLMEVYGSRVLNISSDYVFGGWNFLPPTEKSNPSPVNVYGMTKMVMEDFSKHYGAKVIRLSRTIDRTDMDIDYYFDQVLYSKYTPIPAFFHRNYLTRNQAVDGIEYFVKNFSKLPALVNFGSTSPVSFYKLIIALAKQGHIHTHLFEKRNEYDSTMTPRPKKAGFGTKLAKKLGFPMYSLEDTVKDFWE